MNGISDISNFDDLELGNSVFELIEFSLDRVMPDGTVLTGRYGVNVAKVREVVRMPKINPLASRVKGIAGLFELRGIPIPAVNLALALGDETATISAEQQIIVTEFSKKRAGFIVSTTKRIRRVSWDKVLPPAADKKTCINGMTLVENNEFLFILDLEKIVIDLERKAAEELGQPAPSILNVQGAIGTTPITSGGQAPRKGVRVVLVDDSSLILNSVCTALTRMGYDVEKAQDGQNAVELMQDLHARGDKVDIVVSDVEMPRMNGLTFCKWLKDQPQFAHIPVILHTSLAGQANQSAGFSVGANGYVVKNDIRQLTELIDEILGSHVAATA